MQWSDEAIILSVRPHAETAAVVELFTREHGRHLGLVHGGRSRKARPVLQPGNHVDVTWKARLVEHLGAVSVEARRGYGVEIMEDAAALTALTALASLGHEMPERDPHPNLFEITLFVLGFLDDPTVWPALYVRWEVALLDELGFGLDLAECAVTGLKTDLAYVSPKSGRAVSVGAGEAYKDRLLRLPPFLRGDTAGGVTAADIDAGLKLTGHFIERRLYAPRGDGLPDPRRRLSALITALMAGRV